MIWFVVPVHGRVEKTAVCLRQLARTCAELEACAVVVGNDESLDVARSLGFETVRRANSPLGAKWNDGYQHAGRQGADFVVPLGSDDWVDPMLFTDLPDDGEMRCSKQSSIVSEDGRRLARLTIFYPGGDGVRVLPAALLDGVGWRPAEDDRERAIDTSILRNLTRAARGEQPRLRYFDLHPFQIVDWKSPGVGSQLNTYDACLQFQDGPQLDPWECLADRYPAAALDEMRAVYGLVAA